MVDAAPRIVAAFLRVWKWPVLIASLTMIGLLSALLREERAWWLLSWAALALPLLVILICLGRVWREGRAAGRKTFLNQTESRQ